MDMGYCGKLYMVRESVPSAERARVSKKRTLGNCWFTQLYLLLWKQMQIKGCPTCATSVTQLTPATCIRIIQEQRLRLPVFILQIVSTHELEETDNVKHWVTSKKKTLVLTNINQCQQGCQLILWPTLIKGCFINYNLNQKLVSLTDVILHLSNMPESMFFFCF